MTEPVAQTLSPAELAAQAALAVPQVVGLHGGEFGEVATYLPGRRVTGVRIDDTRCSVHVTVRYPADLFATAERIRDAVREVVSVPVDVTIEDLTGLPDNETGPEL
ncbi:Asp23/Gls24 family envelope stress response protein [Prescottella defluvii]|uniref:Asp23/Gls24 family envelope stress response protein n=1 Tax=Prescottella defluvii TaxID=1323361 RepID=UPI0004F24D75|nr:Asp23/Gls24 family envelope stress response protein [Prescottella defluvii]